MANINLLLGVLGLVLGAANHNMISVVVGLIHLGLYAYQTRKGI